MKYTKSKLVGMGTLFFFLPRFLRLSPEIGLVFGCDFGSGDVQDGSLGGGRVTNLFCHGSGAAFPMKLNHWVIPITIR